MLASAEQNMSFPSAEHCHSVCGIQMSELDYFQWKYLWLHSEELVCSVGYKVCPFSLDGPTILRSSLPLKQEVTFRIELIKHSTYHLGTAPGYLSQGTHHPLKPLPPPPPMQPTPLCSVQHLPSHPSHSC